MTIAASSPVSTLAPSARALIDARLDTIDRMLLGRMPRADRLAIVREVEDQIDELLSARGGEPDRDDVLTVLARIDPPEAFLPADDEPTTGRLAMMPGTQPRSFSSRGGRSTARAAGIAGIAGLASALLFLPLVYMFALLLESELVLFLGGAVALLLAFGCGLAGIILGLVARTWEGWSVAGVVTGAVALVSTVLMAGLGFLLL